MSFSGQVKSELCRTVPAQRCCALAQCFGILLYCNTFTGDGVRIVTESRELGELLPKLFRWRPTASAGRTPRRST